MLFFRRCISPWRIRTGFEAFFSPDVPAGKRYAGKVYISFDYDDVPAAKEAELTFRKMDPETWEPVETFESAKVTFTD